MILSELTVSRSQFESGSGWTLKPEGACLGEVCIPLREPTGDDVDVPDLARQMGLPLVHDETHDIWALGPWPGSGRTLISAQAPELVLPDVDGDDFRLSSLRGRKVLILCWAPY